MEFLVLYVLLAIGGLFLSKFCFRTFWAPLGFFSMVWGGTIILYNIGILPYPDLSFKTHLVLILNLSSFSLACLTIGFKNKLFNTQRVTSDDVIASQQKQIKLLILVGSILSIIGAVLALVVILRFFGELVFSIDVRNFITTHSQEIGKTWLSYVFLLGVNFVTAALSGLYLARFSSSYLPAFLPIVAIIIFSFAELSRDKIYEILIIYVLFFVLSKIIFRWKMNIIKIIVPLMLLIICFVVIISIIG